VAVYMEERELGALLRELRAVARIGTRMALSFTVSLPSPDRAARHERFKTAVEAWGEPARNALTADRGSQLLTASRWRPVELSERSWRAGLVVAAPTWVADAGAGPTTSG
jgi:hypothetical protein